jgi:hypothetical protein
MTPAPGELVERIRDSAGRATLAGNCGRASSRSMNDECAALKRFPPRRTLERGLTNCAYLGCEALGSGRCAVPPYGSWGAGLSPDERVTVPQESADGACA